MNNIMPASTAMTSADFLCFWLFLIVSVPLLWVPPENFRKPFLATAVISTTCCFALFIWSLARAHGAGPLVRGDESTIVGVTPVKGSALAWAFFYGISSQMGQICAGVSGACLVFSESRRDGTNILLKLTTSTDPQHVRLHPFRRPPRRPDPLPSRRGPRDGRSHVSHRHRLHLGCRAVLP
jgi:hypothetical protein